MRAAGVWGFFNHGGAFSDWQQIVPSVTGVTPYQGCKFPRMKSAAEFRIAGFRHYRLFNWRFMNLTPWIIRSTFTLLKTQPRWLIRGNKGYAYWTLVVGMCILLGEVAVVVKAYDRMTTEGDRDLCYYNEKCYRPVTWMDMPTNSGLWKLANYMIC